MSELDSRLLLEAEVAALLQAGETRAACDRVLGGAGTDVYCYLRSLVREPDVADDLYQNWSLAVLEGLPRFEWRSMLRTWLFSIARCQVLQRRRRYSQRMGGRLGTSEAQALASPSVQSPSAQLRGRELLDVIESLAPDDQELIALRICGDLTFAEVAAILELPTETTKKRFQRARQRLLELLPEGTGL